MTHAKPSEEWTRWAAEAEGDGPVSAGGAAARIAALERQERPDELVAVGKAVELRRRERELSAEALSRAAHVTTDSLSALESGLRLPNTPTVLRLVCEVLDLPAEKLIAAGGLNGTPDPELTAAVARFAEEAIIPPALTAPERAALSKFVDVLTGK